MDVTALAQYLDECLDELFEAKGERDVAVPYKVCVAILSLLEHVVEELPGTLPAELEHAAIRVNNALGSVMPRDG
jgi:hypothetical protein